jgi:hypothetical protein
MSHTEAESDDGLSDHWRQMFTRQASPTVAPTDEVIDDEPNTPEPVDAEPITADLVTPAPITPAPTALDLPDPVDEEPAFDVPDPPETGDREVDAAVLAIAAAVHGPLEEQLAVYEAAHRTLQDRLADVEG